MSSPCSGGVLAVSPAPASAAAPPTTGPAARPATGPRVTRPTTAHSAAAVITATTVRPRWSMRPLLRRRTCTPDPGPTQVRLSPADRCLTAPHRPHSISPLGGSYGERLAGTDRRTFPRLLVARPLRGVDRSPGLVPLVARRRPRRGVRRGAGLAAAYLGRARRRACHLRRPAEPSLGLPALVHGPRRLQGLAAAAAPPAPARRALRHRVERRPHRPLPALPADHPRGLRPRRRRGPADPHALLRRLGALRVLLAASR